MDIPPPPRPPRSALVEVLHGVAVPDPFRPLEDPDDPEAAAWIEAQRQRTEAVLSGLPARAEAERFLRSVWAYPRFGLPLRRGSRVFEWRHDGRQAQFTWWVRDGEEPFRLLLDPNKWSGSGTAATGAFVPSPDGSHVAFVRHLAGSDWGTLHVVDTRTGAELPDRIERVRWGGIAWLPDGSGFLYAWPGTENRECLRRHRLHTDAGSDPVVLRTPEPAPSFMWASALPGGRGLACYASRGTDLRHAVWLCEPDGETLHAILPAGECQLQLCHRSGGTLHGITDRDAPRGRLVALRLAAPGHGWRDVVREGDAVLEQAVQAAGRWVLRHTAHGWQRLETRALDGSDPRPVPLPGPGIGWLAEAEPEDREVAFTHTTLARAPTQFRLDPRGGAPAVLRHSAAPADLADCTLVQVFVPARDGARIPMTIIHPAGLARDGRAAAWMYSYGGYGLSSSHGFSFGVLAWVRAGGVYAIASIRGGGEEGEAWHQAATRHKRQVSFNDFQDCAAWLAEQGYCSAETLGIQGGSNGGLLVAACLLQRPELFGAVLCDVPTVDMLRFHRFTVGAGWIPEYGSPDDPADFPHLLAYSPVHNVRAGAAYPPVMVSTADHDDRVVPLHSYKFAAALQEAGAAVALLRVERDAGHWAGASTEQVIRRTADQHAFMRTALAGGFAAGG